MVSMRRILFVNALLAVAFAMSSACAEDKIDPKEDINVYVTKTGTKFHVEDCRTIGEKGTPMALSEAKKKCEACAVCKPLSIVCITPTGKKFHTAECKLAGDKAIEVTLAYAKVKGYEPCKSCEPEKKKDDAKK